MPQYWRFKIREAGRSFFYRGCAAPNLVVAFSLSSRRNGVRIGADRELSPNCGNHRGAHGAGPG